MSIYPVPVKEWYDDPEHAFYKEREALKGMIKYLNCENCKKSLKRCWKRVWVMHSITWGYGEAWCSKKCLEGEKK